MLKRLVLTASKKCAAQIPVDKDVLNYLFQQSAKAYYLEKDLKLIDSVIVAQKEVITYKDSVLRGQSESYAICETQKEICNFQLITANAENKKLSNKVTLFKITTLVTIITTIYALFQ